MKEIEEPKRLRNLFALIQYVSAAIAVICFASLIIFS